MSVEQAYPACCRYADHPTEPDETRTWRPAWTVRPVTIDEDHLNMRLEMGFQPTQFDVVDKVR